MSTIDPMHDRTNPHRDDELTTMIIGDGEGTLYPIPAPEDPDERARWEAGVAAREAAGLSTVVGEDYPDGKQLAVQEDALVERCITALLGLERLHGTRALALAIDEIEHVDTDESGYAERRWAAMPEERKRIERFARAIHEADGTQGAYTPKPVTATPYPPIEQTRLYQLARQVANEPIPDDDAPPSVAARALAEEYKQQQ